MNVLLKKLMEKRGYTDEFLQNIENRRHKLPIGVDSMCEHLHALHESGGLVVLLTDFDMDGITAGVIGYAGMSELGFNVALYLPRTDSYGFDAEDIDVIKAEYPDVKAIVTADVGISAFDGVQRGRDLGIEMLVTDHHSPSGEFVSNGNVVIDPVCDEGEDYFGGICGGHVLYLVLRYYAEHYTPNPFFMVEQIDRLRVFAGFGTISDSMPLFYENRTLVRDAIAICRLVFGDGETSMLDMIPGCELYRRAFFGLYTVMNAFRKRNKLSDGNSIDETFFGYYVAPAFNSIKRMNDDIVHAYNVFFAQPDIAEQEMEYILDLTERRKKLVADAFQNLVGEDAVQPYAPYIYITDAGGGVCGLLAQQIMILTGEPVLVVGRGNDGISYVGSGRCPEWFPFLDLTANLDFVHAAGHNPAFGVSIDGEEGCRDVVAFFRYMIPQVKPADEELAVEPDFRISTVDETADTNIDVELFREFLDELAVYHPFGVGFPPPDLELEFRPKDALWFYLGREKNHIKAILPYGLVLLCFNQAGFFPDKIDPEQFPEVTKVRGQLNLNEFNGNSSVQFLGRLGDDMQQESTLVDDILGVIDDSNSDELVIDLPDSGDVK